MTLIHVVLHVDSSLTEEKVCLHVTAGAFQILIPSVISKSIETETAVFYGRGALKRLPRGRGRLYYIKVIGLLYYRVCRK